MNNGLFCVSFFHILYYFFCFFFVFFFVCSLQRHADLCDAIKGLDGALEHILGQKPLPRTRAEIPVYSREILHL